MSPARIVTIGSRENTKEIPHGAQISGVAANGYEYNLTVGANNLEVEYTTGEYIKDPRTKRFSTNSFDVENNRRIIFIPALPKIR